ncbi:MAG: pitrilysin family protein [Pseudomonadota bacterium]
MKLHFGNPHCLRTYLYSALSTFLLASSSTVWADDHSPSASGTPKNGQPSSVEAKDYRLSRLENGLEIVTYASSKVPLVTFVLVFKAGAMSETPETNGLTHLWEHMFFKGNVRLPKQEDFVRRVRQLGISYNGDTSSEMVRYYFTLPSVHLEEGMQFMADAIRTAKLDKKELEKERVVVLNEYERNASDPGFESHTLRRLMRYGDLAYLRDPLGTKKIILSATVKQLETIKNEVFVPANGALMISGDFKTEKVLALAKTYFGTWKNPKDWKAPVRPSFAPMTESREIISTHKSFENATITHSFSGPLVRENPKDTYAADFLSGLLSHRQNQFYKTFVESGLTFGAQCSYHTQAKAGEIYLSAETSPQNMLKVKDQLLAEIPKWTNESYFTKEQFEDVRTGIEISRIKETATPSAYIKELAFWWAVPNFAYYDSYNDELKKLSFKDIKDYVEKWLLNKPHLTTGLVNQAEAAKLGIKDTGAELADKMLKAYRE